MTTLRLPPVFAPLLACCAVLAPGCVTDEGPSGDTGTVDTGAGDTTEPGDTTDGEPIPDGCAAPTGPGTDIGTALDADATWTPDGSPYRIASTTYLTATLTLEPCTVVELAPDARILVGNDPAPGSVVARGELVDGDAGPLRRPVRFVRLDDAAAWGSIEVDVTGLLDAEHTDFVGGGSINANGTLVAWGATPNGATTPNLRLVDVTVADAESNGIYLPSRAAFTADSEGVRVEGTPEAFFPVWVQAGAVHSLPTGLELVGNAADVVRIETFSNVDDDTFPNRGVPLQVDDALYLGTSDSDGLSTLTIEAGVELQFATGGGGNGILVGLDDDHHGVIIAAGTAEAPITLRSAEAAPAPGDWMGLYFRYTPTDGNVLEHVNIAHAGGPSGAQGFGCGPAENDASVLLLSEQPLTPFLSDVTFSEAGGDTQLLLGWLDASPAATAQAFADGNTFADAPACRVSLPRAEDNGCPGDAEPDCL